MWGVLITNVRLIIGKDNTKNRLKIKWNSENLKFKYLSPLLQGWRGVVVLVKFLVNLWYIQFSLLFPYFILNIVTKESADIEEITS